MPTTSLDFDHSCREPRGCRFIHGDPGDGPWGYCQGELPEGARLGNLANPAYCKEHSRLCVPPAAPFTLKRFHGRAWSDPEVVECSPNHGDTKRLPTDTLIKTNKDGSLSRD